MYSNENAILEDYDYVKLETKARAEEEHRKIKDSLPDNLGKSFEKVVKQSQCLVDNDHQRVVNQSNKNSDSSTLPSNQSNKTFRLDANDKQILSFYSNQAEIHMQHLNTAIEAFFMTIEANQPQKVFIAHSKFVILKT